MNQPERAFELLRHTRETAGTYAALGRDVNALIRDTAEELGEFCAACCIEDGDKPHKDPAGLKESSTQEAVDLVICSLALFYLRGGTPQQLLEYGQYKLLKWDRNLERAGPLGLPAGPGAA